MYDLVAEAVDKEIDDKISNSKNRQGISSVSVLALVVYAMHE